jgi:two-component system response regulator NreC
MEGLTLFYDPACMGTNKISVLIADDHGIVRRGIAALLSLEHDIEVVGQVSDGREAVEQALVLDPDVVLMDISMPVLNGLESTRLLKRQAPQIQVIALSAHDNDEYIQQIINAGAKGYLLKNGPFEDLVAAIRAVASGRSFGAIHPAFAAALSPGAQAEPDVESKIELLPRLTQREREVLQLIAEGASHQKIADRLNISVRTVDTHSNNIMKKLAIHDRAGLVTYAIKNGIVILPK